MSPGLTIFVILSSLNQSDTELHCEYKQVDRGDLIGMYIAWNMICSRSMERNRALMVSIRPAILCQEYQVAKWSGIVATTNAYL